MSTYQVTWKDITKFKNWITFFIKDIDVIVGILRGGSTLAVIASHMLDKEVYWLEAKSYKGRKAEKLTIYNHSVGYNICNKRVLLIDDVVDKGTTILRAKELLEGFAPVCIVPVVLIIKEKSLSLCDNLNLKHLLTTSKDWIDFPWENNKRRKI